MTDRPKLSIEMLQRSQDAIRKEVLMRRVLDGLRSTIQLRGMSPDTPVDDVRADFTDKSAEYLAPLIEAIDILEAIIFASDGCMGHRQCAHSMEPWQRARTLLQGKWESESYRRNPWPRRSYGDCVMCDGYILALSEAPLCPTCSRLKREQSPKAGTDASS